MIQRWPIPTRFLVQSTIHLRSLIFLEYPNWLISSRTGIISKVMTLTAMVPLSNQADVVLVSCGITASIPAILLMAIPLCQKLCSIRVTATSTPSAQDLGTVIRMALRSLSLLFFFFISPSYVDSAHSFWMERIQIKRTRSLWRRT